MSLSVPSRFSNRLTDVLNVFSTIDTSTVDGRAKERQRRILLSAMTAALAKVISVSTGLISVPLTLGYLGVERYGMWMTMSSLVSMLAFADFGIGNGLLSEVAKAYGADDRVRIRTLVSSAYFILSIIAAAVVALFLSAYPFVDWYRVFNVTSSIAREEAAQAIAVLVICFAVAIPVSVVQRVQMGLQRGFMASLWQCAASLMALAGVLIAIHFQAPLPVLVLAFVGAPLLAGLFNSLLFFGILQRDLGPLRASISRRAMRAVTRTGMLFLVLQIVGAIMYSSDNLIIAQLLGAPAVATYAVPTQLFNLISTVLVMLLSPLWPAYAEAIARKDHAWVRKTLRRSILGSVAFASVSAAVLVAATPFILSIWVRSAVTPGLLLLIGLGLWKSIEAGGNALAMYLNGAHIVKLQVATSAITAICAVCLKIALVSMIGVAGAVFATTLSFVLLTAIPTVIYLKFRPGSPMEPPADA